MKVLILAATLFSNVLANPGFVQMPVAVKKSSGATSNATLRARSMQTIPERLQDDFTRYYVDIAIGTPPQNQQVQVDTGSSDLWVYGPHSLGAEYFYDPSKSSTSKYISDGFSISYVDGDTATGDYYTDNTSLGGVNVKFQFAVTEKTAQDDGIFGIATANNEAETSGEYANYPVALKNQGFIESTAYSLYLNGLNAEYGSLLFGGVDTSKYSGQLYTVPITSSSHFYVDFEYNGHKLNGDLDSGTSFIYLPDDIANGLAHQVGATWSSEHGAFFVEKAFNMSMTFSFSGAEVTVPSSELFTEWNGGIVFTVGPSSYYEGSIILGDAFLRSAYVVYDLDNNQVAIAQADYNKSGSIEPITSSGIPGAKPAPGF